MKHLLGILLALSLALGMLAGVASATDEETLYEYNHDATTGNSSAYDMQWLYQSFNATIPHTVTTIRLPLSRGGNPYGIQVSIRLGNSTTSPVGPTGSDIVSSSIVDADDFSASPSWMDFSIDSTNLEAGQTYCIVLRAVFGAVGDYINWEYSGNNTSLGDVAAAGNSTNSGITWNTSVNRDFLFELWGGTTLYIRSAEVYTDYLEDDDQLFVVEYINICPPYHDQYKDPEQWFEIRLLDIDGSTVIASSPCRAYGDRPGSIYLSATSAASLEQGGNYTIQLYGDFGTGPHHSYILTSGDWKGGNLVFLDSWCIQTAHSMEDYDGLVYTDIVEGQGEVLNRAGGELFLRGIPMLSVVRENLFQYPLSSFDLTMTEGTVGIGQNWEVAMGTSVKASMEATGDLIGLTGKETAAVLTMSVFAVGVLICALIGSAAFGVVLAIPIVVFGAWAGFISISGLAVFIIMLAVLFAMWFWWQPT